MSYAEDETDVEGTVNGVTATTTGKRKMYVIVPPVCICYFMAFLCLESYLNIPLTNLNKIL